MWINTTMNNCRRVNFNDWRSGLTTVLCRVNVPTNCRNQVTSAKQRPETEDKPRLRAIDVAHKIQAERTNPRPAERTKSEQQKRVMELKRFSLQLQHVHPNVLAKHLHRGVLYRDEDLVVINKPYGVPVRDDCGATSISSVLPVLTKLMGGSKIKCDHQLLPCLKLEKETTGALLLARTEKVVEHILNLDRNNQIQRKFWAITVGVPVPSEGVIDIPIIEREVTGTQPHYKMALSPIFRVNDAGDGVTKVRAHRQAQPAVTKYRVLDSSSGCSLVELQPYTGVKHQIRVHMALALMCPILGDHKYSHWTKLAPQKLPERVLGKLGLEQSKVRYLPLHVLARQLTLPGHSRAEVSVSCPLPKYFTQTLNRLHLTVPDEKELK